MYSHCDHDDCSLKCKHTSTASQSMDEMDFDRGIWSAAMYGEIDKIKKCLDKTDVNTTDKYGFTALHYAARNGQLEACKYLVKRGANVNVQTKELRATPLHRAVSDIKL
ncbi:ankyrin repeat domain-containing protein 39 isoform X2 [Aethina tumida]|uniref:ankyrin repeat domain-containing protein 39 isoform X2 n=1 Tax=Aethina tumida TaxID=116153 RepID=UPI00096B2495|nr:ankyrin repeat domain-containing protein 39 isoform X2 [Aethina tumida]